jgi:hypothetical protein
MTRQLKAKANQRAGCGNAAAVVVVVRKHVAILNVSLPHHP